MATERLYYQDSYLVDFAGNLLEIAAGGKKIYLDRTAFYPTSGGQPHDRGELAGTPVLEVIDEDDGRIAHLLAEPVSLPAGQPLSGKIDWARRYEHMQQHTGQHLLSAVLFDLFAFPTLSFHMGDDVSAIELGAKEISEPQLARAEDDANEAARRGTAVKVTFADASAVSGLRKQSERTGTLRIVEIEGVDKSACGGTHVRSLAETLPLQIRRLEKVRGNVRIEFVCGARAIRRARRDFRLLQEVSRHTAAAIDKSPETVAAWKDRLADAEKERQRLAQELAQREGREAYTATQPGRDGLRRAYWRVDRIGETERAKAMAYCTGALSAVLVAGKDPAGVLIACSPDSGVNAGAVLKQVMTSYGGRGGGSATLAQGSLPNEDCLTRIAQELKL